MVNIEKNNIDIERRIIKMYIEKNNKMVIIYIMALCIENSLKTMVNCFTIIIYTF